MLNHVSELRALSFKQPYGSLLANCNKIIETRTWDTPYRGKVLICISKVGYSLRQLSSISHLFQYKRMCSQLPMSSIFDLNDLTKLQDNHWKVPVYPLYLGQAIAIADLVETRKMRLEDEKPAMVVYNSEIYSHIYENVERILPFPYKGGMKWTNVNESIIRHIELL